MVFYEGGLFMRVVSYQGGLLSGWSLRVVSYQGGHLSGWPYIRVVSYQGCFLSRWSFTRVLSYQSGLSSGWSFIRVVSYQGGLLSGWILSKWCFTKGFTVFLYCSLSLLVPAAGRFTAEAWALAVEVVRIHFLKATVVPSARQQTFHTILDERRRRRRKKKEKNTEWKHRQGETEKNGSQTHERFKTTLFHLLGQKTTCKFSG